MILGPRLLANTQRMRIMNDWMKKKYEKSVDQKSEGLYYRRADVWYKSCSMPPIDMPKGIRLFWEYENLFLELSWTKT